MRINLIFLDIFSYVLRHDDDALSTIKDRINNGVDQDYSFYLKNKGDAISERLSLILGGCDSSDKEDSDDACSKHDKETIEALLIRLNKSGIDKFLYRIDKVSINMLLDSFFKNYFKHIDELKKGLEKLNS